MPEDNNSNGDYLARKSFSVENEKERLRLKRELEERQERMAKAERDNQQKVNCRQTSGSENNTTASNNVFGISILSLTFHF
jgi:hypothetical protein